MIRVGEFSNVIFEPRRRFWCDALKLPVSWVDFNEEALSVSKDLLQSRDFDGLLLPLMVSEQLLPLSSRLPTGVLEAGMADCLVRENGKLWLRCFLREALHQLILQKSPKLNTHAIVYITGSDKLARMCAAVAIQMGFQRIVMIAEDQEAAQLNVQGLLQMFFGLDFKVLRETELTLQPNNGSLLLNTLTAEEGGVVFEDLTYLNFLKQDGLVVHLPLQREKNPLIEEAMHVGISYLCGEEIWGLRDCIFLKDLRISLPSSEEYLRLWQEFLQKEKQT